MKKVVVGMSGGVDSFVELFNGKVLNVRVY